MPTTQASTDQGASVYLTGFPSECDYTLDACDDLGKRYTVHSNDLLEAVCELAVLLGCDLSDI